MRLSIIALATLAATATAGRAAQLNMPGDILGTWSGGCTQVETSTHTEIDALFEMQSDTLVLGSWTTHGPFFGCPAADPGGYPLFRNAKRDGFTAHSVYVKGHEQTQPWGIVKVKTVKKGTVVVVHGKKACNGAGPKKYSGSGTLDNGVFTLTMKAKIQGETANFTCTWTRTP